MLRSLGMHVDYPVPIIGNNSPVIESATVHERILKKKHVAISYHKTREAAEHGITHPLKIDSEDNMTKSQLQKLLIRQIRSMMN